LVGEFEDSALMGVCSSGGRGFTVVQSVVERAALKQYGLRKIARVKECGNDFYAITADRRVQHPGVVAITDHAYSEIFA
jgi:LysR family transcriptional activator of nhaA